MGAEACLGTPERSRRRRRVRGAAGEGRWAPLISRRACPGLEVLGGRHLAASLVSTPDMHTPWKVTQNAPAPSPDGHCLRATGSPTSLAQLRSGGHHPPPRHP